MSDALRLQVELAQSGDPEAMAWLAAACHEEAVRMARSVVADRHRAEDAAQEGLLRAFARLGELREPAAFRGWLATIVRNQARRQGRRALDLLETPEASADAAPGPLAQAELAERRARVRAAVAGLTPATRSVSERYYLRGESLAETAAALGLPEGTVKRRLFEARERLRSRLALHEAPARRAPTPPARRRRLRRPL